MMNELETIKQVLRQSPAVKINSNAKQAAISLALAEFDKNNLQTAQGNENSTRLMAKTTQRSIAMKTYQLTLVGTFCVLFLVLAFMQTQSLNETLDYWHGFKTPTQGKSIGELRTPAPVARVEEKGRVDSPVIQATDAKKADVMPAEAKPVAPSKEEAVALAGASKTADYEADKSAIATRAIAPSELAKNQPSQSGRIAYAVPPVTAPITSNVAGIRTLKAKGDMAYKFAPAKTNLIAPTAPSPGIIADQQIAPYYHDQGRDKFEDVKANPVKLTKDEPVSTFSIDVDTASYSFVRQSLNQNVLPQKNAVRIEEMVNYFPYQYTAPSTKEEPFKANISVLPSPWNKETKLLHVGIKGYQLDTQTKPQANLVFLIDTSGSMNEPNKLPLVQNSLKMLLDNLNEEDSVGIVTYAGNAGVALQPTKVKEKSKISAVIDNLGAGGSTAGAEGIRQAYQLAEQNLNKNGINRVILATDGDFNVGITDTNELKSFVEHKRASGVTLSVLGYGTGNYNDALMQTLAQNGNGNAAYIDTLNEARKALVEEAGSTLFTIAKDVKIQVEFNPEQVAEYRLIGYETRLLNREDFNNDKVDAGDIGAGHSVTALYEITPVNSKAQLVDELRYKKIEPAKENKNSEYAFVKIRYKLPDSDTSKLITTPVNQEAEYKSLEQTPAESRFATSVAAFGQLLRHDPYLKAFNYDQVISLAESAKGEDKFGYRAEFINLVRIAKNAPALPKLQ